MTTRIRPLLDQLIDQERLYTFEGARGLRNMEKITSVLGYRSLTDFLQDNSGAVECIYEWIATSRCEDFAEKLAQAVTTEE